MATLLLSPIGILVQQLNNSGQPLSGGLINTYVAGTTTPVATYTDSTGSTPNSNPIVLNSAGRLTTSVWVPSNTPHKMILTDSLGVTLSTIDQLYGINDPFLINQVSTTLPTGGGTANAQTITNITAITSQANGTEQWYTPGVANTGATNINVDGLGNMAVHYLTKSLVGGELQPGVPVILKSDGTFWNIAWSAKGPATDFYADTGAVNAITIAVVNEATLALGARLKIKVANTNTTNATITVNGSLGPTIYVDQGFTIPAPAGSLVANGIYDFIYTGGSGWLCLNPSPIVGSFTITLTGMSGATTGTVNYRVGPDGRTVYVYITAAINGTSNATSMTGTGIPAILSPTTSKTLLMRLRDSGTIQIGTISTGTATTWTFGLGVNSGNFTNTGTKGIDVFEFTYTLD